MVNIHQLKLDIMKKGLLFSLLLSITIFAGAQEYYMTSPVGYGRNTTGGNGGRVVTVSTLSALRSALQSTEPLVIIVTENITFGEGQRINTRVTNKTLLGLKGVKLITTAQVKDGGILQLSANSNNVIIRNLIFEGPGAYDVDGNDLLSNAGCNNLWVDHCEFYDGVDGNFDNTNGTDNVSISWCKFGYKLPPKAGGSGGANDHRFTNLIGGGAGAAPADGQYSITFQFCYWAEGCRERMPRARNAQLHILNCYYNTSATNSLALGLEAGTVGGTTCYVEGTDFKKISRVYSRYNASQTLPVALRFVDCLKAGNPNVGVANIGNALRPTYEYTALPVSQVEAAITGPYGAGATLDVTVDGIVSSPSSIGSVQEASYRILQTDNEFIIDGVVVKELTLYNLLGKNVKSAAASQTIDTSGLHKGTYILSIFTEEGKRKSEVVIKH